VGIRIAGWQQEVIDHLEGDEIRVETDVVGDFLLLKFPGFPGLILHLVPINHHFDGAILHDLQESYRKKSIQLIQLWEDLWLTQPSKVLSRIFSLLGKNKTVHGRKTKVLGISQLMADEFLSLHHLQFSAKARFRYGLLYQDQLIAVATFSGKRNMRLKREGYISVELIRFATLEGITIQGGLSKLIRHMINEIAPDDVMTYADLDWSYGQGFARMGFELVFQSPPAEIWLHTKTMTRVFPHRLPDELRIVLTSLDPSASRTLLEAHGYKSIYNSGNLKFILTV